MEPCVERAHTKRAAAAIAVLALHFCLLLAVQCSEVGARPAKPRHTLHLDGNARNKTQHERLEPSRQAASQLQQVPPEIPAGMSGETVQAVPSGLASGVPDDLLTQLQQTLPGVLNESSSSSNARAAPVVSEDVLARLQQVAPALLAGSSGETDKAVPSELASGVSDDLSVSASLDRATNETAEAVPSFPRESGKEIGEGLSGFRKVMQKFEHFRKRQGEREV